MNLTDIYTLEIGRKSMPLIINAKQVDGGYPITFKIVQNGVTVPEATDTAEFHVSKPDGTFSWVAATVNADGSITANITEQMLAVAGKCLADITITKSDMHRSTFNFYFQVEPKPGGADIPSQTEFTLLVETLERAEADLYELEHVTIQAALDAKDDAEAAAERAEQSAEEAATVMAGSVRFDQAQNLSETQKARARANIGAASAIAQAYHYTVRWDKVNAQCTRLNDAASITTNTANFGHFGAVNENYDNPFDNIYPWSGRKLCNIDIDLYRGLTASDDITDCVVAWEDDVNFDYAHQYGVWVYTPPFFGRSYELDNYRYFDVTDENLQDNIAYPAMITGRWHGADVMLTIDGASKHCNLPVLGLSMANIAMSTQHTYAKNWGASLTDIYTLDASTLLFIVEYATLNSQNAVGNGVSDLNIHGLHLSADVSNSNIVTIATYDDIIIPGAVFIIGTTTENDDIARTYIESVSGTTVTLHDAVTATTAHYVSIRGLINVADDGIGSKSGYIGTNGKCNAYYRGEVLWGNKWQYILGCYRQTGTGALWIAEEGDTDNYDALNTSAHIDTRAVLPEVSRLSRQYINGLSVVDKLSVAPFISSTGGNNTNPVGDSQSIPVKSADDTICLSGGDARSVVSAGLFCVDWSSSASKSYWFLGSRPRLKNPS